MPIEIQATIAGVCLTALFAILAYFYRSTIIYEIISIETKLKVDGEKVVSSSEWNAFNLFFERITIKNVGFLDIDGVKLHVDRTPDPISIKVSKSDSISKSAIQLSNVDDQLEISLATFPRGEQIVVELAYAGFGGSEYRDVKAAGGKYRVQKKSHRQAFIEGFLYALLPVAFTVLIISIVRASF